MFSSEFSEVPAVSIPYCFVLPGGREALRPELSQQLQHFEAWLPGLKIDRFQHTLRRQRHQLIQRISAQLSVRINHCLDRAERAAAGEHGKSLEEYLLLTAQQVVAPGERCPHGALPLGQVARPTRKNIESL